MDHTLDSDVEAFDEDPFALDVRIVTDLGASGAPTPCDTNDGCPPTCASSCVSE